MILVTGGCSFSDITGNTLTWPIWLQRTLNLDDANHYATGIGAVGNGIISRQIMYKVNELLQAGITAKDLLVGIMWSACDRHEIYKSTPVNLKKNIDGWHKNPIHMPEEDPGNWIVLAHHWKHKYNIPYYKAAHDSIYSIIQTLEHVLRVQHYLELNNIKYFMTTYMDKESTLGLGRAYRPGIKALTEMINWDTFLPVEGEYEWCKQNCNWQPENELDKHPQNEQHQKFVEQVIKPHLKNKLNIL